MTRFRFLALLAIVVLVFAACGDDSDDDSASATTAAATTTTQLDEAAAKAEITATFEKFFNGADADTAGKIAILENGPKLQGTYEQASANGAAKGSTTKVQSVEILKPADCEQAGVESPCALVVHDLLVNGTPALEGQKSYAVQVDGKWKVSQLSYCAFTGLGGVTCPE
jgi:hypothetical protein